MREKINQKYNSLILGLNKNDRTYQARKEFFENKIEEELDAIGSLEKNLKKNGKKEISRHTLKDWRGSEL